MGLKGEDTEAYRKRLRTYGYLLGYTSWDVTSRSALRGFSGSIYTMEERSQYQKYFYLSRGVLYYENPYARVRDQLSRVKIFPFKNAYYSSVIYSDRVFDGIFVQE